MAKTMVDGTQQTTAQDEMTKRRKKQAKKEAKMMLKLEQARKAVQKAEQKVTKAQNNLKENTAYLHELELNLQQLQVDNQATLREIKITQQDEHQTDKNEETPLKTPEPSTANSEIQAKVSVTTPPAQEKKSSSVTAAEKDLTIQSGDGSMPLITENKQAWPPEPVREELASAITQEMAQDQGKDEKKVAQDRTPDAQSEVPSPASGTSKRSTRSTRGKTTATTDQETPEPAKSTGRRTTSHRASNSSSTTTSRRRSTSSRARGQQAKDD